MAILQPKIPLSLYSHHFHFPLHSPTAAPFLCTPFKTPRKPLNLTCSPNGQDDYLIDAPVSAGDGFSFSGGKYSDGPSPSDEWFKQGKIVKAHPVSGSGDKAKDPIFGLKMGAASQASNDLFRAYRLKHALSLYDFVQ